MCALGLEAFTNSFKLNHFRRVGSNILKISQKRQVMDRRLQMGFDEGFTAEVDFRNQVSVMEGPDYASKVELANIQSIIKSYFNFENIARLPNEVNYRSSSLDSVRIPKIIDQLLVIYALI